MNKKLCKTCETVKEEKEFGKGRRVCKLCFRDVNKSNYLKNRQKIKDAYVPTGNRRGRPVKIIEEDILVKKRIRPIESDKDESDIESDLEPISD